MGSQTRYGRRLSGSGFRATRKRACPSVTPSIRSGCLAVVIAEQTGEPDAPPNFADFRAEWITSSRGRPQVTAAVRSLAVVMRAVGIENRLQVAPGDDQHPVQAFAPAASDPAFAMGI